MNEAQKKTAKFSGAAGAIALASFGIGIAAGGDESKPLPDNGVAPALVKATTALEYYALGGKDPGLAARTLHGDPEPVAPVVDPSPQTTELLSREVAPGVSELTGVTLPEGMGLLAGSLVATGDALNNFTIGAITSTPTECGEGKQCNWVEVMVKNTSKTPLRFTGKLTYGSEEKTTP